MSKYDLLITGGRVLDPANELDEVCDIAISNGYIEKVQKEIDPSFGKSVEINRLDHTCCELFSQCVRHNLCSHEWSTKARKI